jgi:hypothetical protein
MTGDTTPPLWISLVPRSDTDTPTYWWSALRYMQAVRTLAQMDQLAQRLLKRMEVADWPWVRGVPDEPHEGALTWEVPHVEVVKAEDKREASFIASEALHYLRSSLDHLVYNGSWIDTGSPQKRTQFPICDSAGKWASRDTQKQLGGLSPLHSSWVEAVQPFKGVEWTKTLQTLSNADKHRFGVEVSPTCQLKVALEEAIEDPTKPGFKLARIERLQLRLLLPALEPYGDFSSTFNGILAGIAGLLNQFLDEAGMSQIEVGAERIVSAERIE